MRQVILDALIAAALPEPPERRQLRHLAQLELGRLADKGVITLGEGFRWRLTETPDKEIK